MSCARCSSMILEYARHGCPMRSHSLLMHKRACICRRDVLQPLSEQGGSKGCRVIAFDRPPYGLSERPLTWPAGPEGNPYTSEVIVPIHTAYVLPSVAVPGMIIHMMASDVLLKYQHCCTDAVSLVPLSLLDTAAICIV